MKPPVHPCEKCKFAQKKTSVMAKATGIQTERNLYGSTALGSGMAAEKIAMLMSNFTRQRWIFCGAKFGYGRPWNGSKSQKRNFGGTYPRRKWNAQRREPIRIKSKSLEG